MGHRRGGGHGRLNAQEAFIGGRILLTGDQQKLIDSQPVFGALDAVFASVRRTHRVPLRRSPCPSCPRSKHTPSG